MPGQRTCNCLDSNGLAAGPPPCLHHPNPTAQQLQRRMEKACKPTQSYAVRITRDLHVVLFRKGVGEERLLEGQATKASFKGQMP